MIKKIKNKMELLMWRLRYMYHRRATLYYTYKMCKCSRAEESEVYARKATEHLKRRSDMVSQLLGIAL